MTQSVFMSHSPVMPIILEDDTTIASTCLLFDYNNVRCCSNETNASSLSSSSLSINSSEMRLGALWLTVLIVITATGNVLVCLAVCWERRLQNITNYFLMSLAIADLLVSLLVMPFAVIVQMYGESFDLLLLQHAFISQEFNSRFTN